MDSERRIPGFRPILRQAEDRSGGFLRRFWSSRRDAATPETDPNREAPVLSRRKDRAAAAKPPAFPPLETRRQTTPMVLPESRRPAATPPPARAPRMPSPPEAANTVPARSAAPATPSEPPPRRRPTTAAADPAPVPRPAPSPATRPAPEQARTAAPDPGEEAAPGDLPLQDATFFARHFGLKERPFTLLPDPDFLLWTKAHRRAFSVLEYGLLTRAPITVITGEVGAGKTTLLQRLLKNLDDTAVVGLISNAQGDRGELLQWVLSALDIPCDLDAPYVEMFQKLTDFAIARYAEGQHVVLIIDEAQNLSVEGLEELRMLTNINSNKDELLQLILMGQPELRAMIQSPRLRQFAQRVGGSFHIPAMDRDTTRRYIRHRLCHAGGTGDEVTEAAAERVFEAAGGVPRLVNKLCDLAMVYAVSAEKTVIDVDLVDEVLADGIFVTSPEGDGGATIAPISGHKPKSVRTRRKT